MYSIWTSNIGIIDVPCLSTLLRIRGGKVRRKKHGPKPENGMISEGISSFVGHLRSGQLQLSSNAQFPGMTLFENVSVALLGNRTEEFMKTHGKMESNSYITGAGASDKSGAVTLYEKIGLRSSALENEIGEKIANETLSPSLYPPENEDDCSSSGSEDENPEVEMNFCDSIGILPKDDMPTITQKYLQHLIARGNDLAAQLGISDWMKSEELGLLNEVKEEGDSAGSEGPGEQPQYEWVDLNSEVPPGREKAFIKAVCRQILFVRNLPKRITPVRAPYPLFRST